MTINTSAGRSNSISNLIINNGNLLTLEAELNNLNGPNSSPTFTTLPTPFYCINIPQQYNQGAVDADSDSLSYALTDALIPSGTNNVTPATYVFGLSGSNPLSVAPGAFSFSSLTGQLSFTPDVNQQSTVVNRVREFRNGVQVGSAMREMNFIVLSCSNTPPSSGISTGMPNPVFGGSFSGSTVTTCQGTDSIAFHIQPIDPENTNIKVTTNGLPAGAIATISYNNTLAPDLLFSWKTLNVAPGSYTFFVTVSDAGCPLSSQQTQAFTIVIVRKPSFSYQMTTPTRCVGPAQVSYSVDYGAAPRTLSIYQNGTLVKTKNSSANIITDTLPAGNYSVTINSSGIDCSSSYAFSVVDSGTYPFTPEGDSAFYCLNDPAVHLTASLQPNAIVHWYDGNGNPLSSAPIPSTATAGIFTYLVSQQFKVCESLKDTVPVYVTPRPVSAFDAPNPFCARDTMTVRFTGAIGVGPIIDYVWNWAGADTIAGESGGPYRVVWETPGQKVVSLQVLENKCPGVPVSQIITIKPKPFAIISAKDFCARDVQQIANVATVYPGQAYNWTFPDSDMPTSTSAGPINVTWLTEGTRRLSLKVSLDGCEDSGSKVITIFPKPDAGILEKPETACLGDKIYLKADGAETYVWTPENAIYTEPDGRVYTRAMTPLLYTVYAANTYGCKDTDTYELRAVEPCCNFSYPNAFTPNGDGKNDGFHVVMYGNPIRYDLSIYNRYGQRVFRSFDPKAIWDGRLNGQDCEPGVYMYYLKARCMTGRDEEQKGDLMLVR